MLARAGSKLALEKLVIKRGAFVDSKEVSTQGLGADELIHLLKPTEESGDDPQSGVVDEQVTPEGNGNYSRGGFGGYSMYGRSLSSDRISR